MTGLTWFGELIRWFATWFPRLQICGWNEAGLRLRRGGGKRTKDPRKWWARFWVGGGSISDIPSGHLYVYIPAVTRIIIDSIERREWTLPWLRLTLDDATRIKVRVSMVGKLSNMRKAHLNTYDIEGEVIPNRGCQAVGPVICKRDLPEFLKEQYSEIGAELTRAIHDSLIKFGFDIEEAYVREAVKIDKVVDIGSGSGYIDEDADEDEE